MTKEKANPQSPEEMAKAAQEAAVKAAMEQAQAMFGSIPGFQMPEGMQEQLMGQMGAGMPDMAAAQAQHEAMLKAAGIDPETVAQAEHGIRSADDAGNDGRDTREGTVLVRCNGADDGRLRQ